MARLNLPDLQHCAPQYTARCAKCGEKGYKREMTSIHVKTGSYDPLKKLCHVCQRCLAQLLDELEVSMPD